MPAANPVPPPVRDDVLRKKIGAKFSAYPVPLPRMTGRAGTTLGRSSPSWPGRPAAR